MKTVSVLSEVRTKVLYVLHMNASLLSGNDFFSSSVQSIKDCRE